MAAVARDLHLAARIMAVRAAILATLLGRTTASGMGAFVPKFLGLGLLGNGFGVHFALRYLGTTRLCDAPAILEDGACRNFPACTSEGIGEGGGATDAGAVRGRRVLLG